MLREIKPHETRSEKQGSGRPLNLKAALFGYWVYGLAAFIVVLAAGIPFAWMKGKSVWRAEGVIYVSPHFQRNLDTDPEKELPSNTQYREFVQQQVRTMNRYDIVHAALAPSGAATGFWVKKNESDRRSTDRLRGSLEINPVPDTYMVTVALEGEKAQGLAEIVNGVMESYVGTMRSELLYGTNSRLENLRAERGRMDQTIASLMDQRSALASQLGTTVFTESIVNSYDKMLGASSEALAQARRDRFIADAGSGKAGTGSAVKAGLSAEAFEKAMTDPGAASFKGALNVRKAQLLSSISGLSAQHAGRIAAEKELKQIDQELERMTDSLQTKIAGSLQTVRDTKAAQAESVENALRHETTNLRSQAEAYSRAYQRSVDLGGEIDRLRKRRDAVDDRVSDLQLEAQAPGWVRVFSPALTPDLPIKGGRKKLFGYVLLAALALALAVPVGIDYMDPRIRAAGELEFHSGIPVAACLPLATNGPDQLDPEAILRAAVSVRRHLAEMPNRALVISAVDHGGGSTTFTLALGAALNRLGVRTLCVEANPITRDERYGGGNGLIGIFNGNSAPESCILPANNLLPDRIPTGDGSIEDLLPAEQLLSLIETTADGYDLLLVDAAPVFVSLATEELVRVAGSALMVANAQVDKKADVAACIDRLARVNPRAFGAVLNKVTTPRSSFSKGTPNDATALFAA